MINKSKLSVYAKLTIAAFLLSITFFSRAFGPDLNNIAFAAPDENKSDSLRESQKTIPSLVIIPEFQADCRRKDHGGQPGPGAGDIPSPVNQNCFAACDSSTIKYFTPLNTSSTYQWIVTGAVSYTPNNNEVTVSWGSAGSGFITLVETDSLGNQDSVTRCVEIIESPEANFTSLPPMVGGVINVCLGQDIYFTNTSTGEVAWHWDFGDGYTHNGEFPSPHAYSVSGTYTVTLVVENECGCKDTATAQVIVDELPAPEIYCPSVVCAGDTATYSTDADCPNITWSVTGEAVVLSSLNSNPLVVVWGDGSNGPGTVTLDVSPCDSFCTTPTTVLIPIVPSNADIDGDSIVCLNDIETYSLPKVPGTTYTWTISGGGFIQTGQGMHEISVFWNTPGSYVIKVNYYNSFLECGGTAILNVDVLPEMYISGPQQLCENTFNTSNPFMTADGFSFVPADWSVITPGNTLLSNLATATAFFSAYDWSAGPGVYTVIAVNSSGSTCNDTAQFFVQVLSAPPAPGINGDTLICPGGTHQYTAVTSQTNVTFNWNVTGGNIIPSGAGGNTVTITWNNTGPYSISLSQTYATGPACESGAFVLNVDILASPVITGPMTSCVNGTGTYTATLIPGLTYNWSLSPSGVGSIVSGQGTNSVDVQWLNASGTATLSISYPECPSMSSTLTGININNAPVPTITPSGDLCEGGSITLTSSAGSSYVWTDESNVAFGGNNQTVTITEGGEYHVQVTYANGCVGNASITINEKPSPVASISSPFQVSYCGNQTVPNITLYALTGSGYTFQWYQGASLISGATNATYTTNVPGCYKVVVTLASCSKTSNTICITYDPTCPSDGCTTNETVDFTHGNCNPVSFNGIISLGIGSYSWNFGDPASGANNLSANLNPTHLYTQAGFYNVTFIGTGVSNNPPPDSCAVFQIKTVEVPIAALFEFSGECVGDSIEFTDLSTYTPGNNITSWSWNFGDPGSGAANTSSLPSPAHVYSSQGSYVVTLTVSNGTCTVTYTDTVEVTGVTPGFTFAPNPTCVNEPVSFQSTSTSSSPIINWFWDFGDGTSSVLEDPDKSFDPDNNYNVTLHVTNAKGCTDSITQTVTILPPPVPGAITLSGPDTFCAGDSVTLTAPAGTSYLWSTGATTASITVYESGNYFVEVTNSNGCKYNTAPVTIVVVAIPDVEITGRKTICEGEQIAFSTGIFGSYNFQWYHNGSQIPGANTNQYQKFGALLADSGIYVVEVSDTITGCSAYDTVKLTVNPKPVQPVIAAGSSGTLCADEPHIISVTNVDPSLTYTWNTGQQGTSITTSASGVYNVTAYNQYGCGTNSNSIFIAPLPDVSCVITGCYEFCDTLLPDTIPGPPGFASYVWLGVDSTNTWGPVGTGQDLVVYGSGTFQLVLTNFYGCTDTSDLIEVNYIPCGGCEQTSVSAAPVEFDPTDPESGDCCWKISLQNFDDDSTYAALGIHAINGVSLDYTAYDPNWTLQNMTDSTVTILPVGGYIPYGTISDFAKICLSGQQDSVQLVEFIWYGDAPEYEILCRDTLEFNCAPDNDCITIVEDSIYCEGDSLIYSFTVQNNSNVTLQSVHMVLDSLSGVTGTPHDITIPPLAPGNTYGPINVTLSGSIVPGDTLCFSLSAHDDEDHEHAEFCCHSETQYCIEIPPLCNPCDSLNVSVEAEGFDCCWNLSLYNNAYVDIIGVQTEIISGGAFGTIDNPLGSPWSVQMNSSTNIVWKPSNGGNVPVADTLPTFCLNNLKDSVKNVLVLHWLVEGADGDSVLCSDTLTLDCISDCMAIVEDSVVCDPNGGYLYNFSIYNNFNLTVEAFEFFQLDPAGAFPSGQISGPIPVNGLGNYSIPVFGNPGDTICFRIRAFDHKDSHGHDNCCTTDSVYCMVLPDCGPCEPGITGPDILCKGDVAELCIETCCENAEHISWSTGQTGTDCIKVEKPGEYSVKWVCDGMDFFETIHIGAGDNPNCKLKVDPVATVPGGFDHTIYLGYGPQCVNIKANGGGLSYLWSNGATTQITMVCPTATTVYTVTVTNEDGCSSHCSQKICVRDVRCGDDLSMVEVCINGVTECVDSASVEEFLQNGAVIGSCELKPCDGDIPAFVETVSMKAYPNPFSGKSKITFRLPNNARVKLELYSLDGKDVIPMFNDLSVKANVEYQVEVDARKLSGSLYIARLTTDYGAVEHIKLMVTE